MELMYLVIGLSVVMIVSAEWRTYQAQKAQRETITALGEQWKLDRARTEESYANEKGRLVAENKLLRDQFLEANRLLSVMKMAGGKAAKPPAAPRMPMSVAPIAEPHPTRNGRIATTFEPDVD